MRAALEKKAKLYDKLRKGKTGGLTDKQYDSLLVDVSALTLESILVTALNVSTMVAFLVRCTPIWLWFRL